MILTARIFLLIFCAFLTHAIAFADGSRDLYPRYPSPVQGNRAFLISRSPSANNVFYNQAAHFVYAKSGEVIAVASSAQGMGNGFIRLVSPSGKMIETRAEASGNIPSRAAEVAGPGSGYTPFEILVDIDEEGVWKVEFLPTGFEGANASGPAAVKADADWVQGLNSFYIAAWDISVRKAGDPNWIKGRVYTNVLHLYINSQTLNDATGAFYGKNYVLTKDGYIYKVDGNGSHGIEFQYFVNSSGILDINGKPLYESSNDGARARFHNPNMQDDTDNVTHKMFYTFPDVSMPTSSPAPSPINNTWLYKEIEIAEINSIGFETIEGNKNYVNKKGAFIVFNTNYVGRYKITLEPESDAFYFSKREIVVSGQAGFNKALWDGLDGNGQFIPGGEDYPVKVSVSLMEGEIHFPYFDMEINPQGILVDRYNPDGTLVSPAIMYWDDKNISRGASGESSDPISNLDGIPSNINGHKWGTYRLSVNVGQNYFGNDNYGAFSFGNNKAMDTWSYSAQVAESIQTEVTVEVADLEVVEVLADKKKIELDEKVEYRIKVRNNGPSDAVGATFHFNLPDGFNISEVTFNSTCDTIRIPVTSLSSFSSEIDLTNQCEGTFTVIASASNEIFEPYGMVEGRASIVRPAGFTDPNATSTQVDKNTPGTAQEECNAGCNNIYINSDVFLLEPVKERGRLALVKTVRHVDSNGNGFQEAGEVLEYTFTIHNPGEVDEVSVSSLYIEDPLLGTQKIEIPGVVLAPKDSTVRIVGYTIRADDVVKGRVENIATVYGQNPRGFVVKDVSGTSIANDHLTVIDIDQSPKLSLKKSVINTGTGENNQFTIGDRIDYLFEIKHEGKISIGELSLIDNNLQDFTNPLTEEYFSNNTLSFILSYIVTEEDIERGYIEHATKVEARDQKYGNIISDRSGHTFEDDLPTVTEVATPPKSTDGLMEIYQGNEGWFDVLKNAVLGSSSLSSTKFEIIDQPQLATISVENGLIRYTPTPTSVFGADSFSYRLIDNSRLRSKIVRVDVRIIKTVPIAEDDSYAVEYNYQTRINLTQNDHVKQSYIIKESIFIVDGPINGELKNEGAGIFRYIPKNNYTGYDKFTYIVQDGNGNWSEPATVNIEVKGFFLPNTITPNGDQRNDSFEILGIYLFDRVELEVVDRFGKVIFRSADYRNDWIVDPQVKEGTYFYIFKGIKAASKPTVRQGSLLIVREMRGM